MRFPSGHDEQHQSRMTERYRKPPRRLRDPSCPREMAKAFGQRREEMGIAGTVRTAPLRSYQRNPRGG